MDGTVQLTPGLGRAPSADLRVLAVGAVGLYFTAALDVAEDGAVLHDGLVDVSCSRRRRPPSPTVEPRKGVRGSSCAPAIGMHAHPALRGLPAPQAHAAE